MKQYYFEKNEFVIENFDTQKTFASFLPGIAGKRGIPLWAFYVNRGQGIASFGLENKDNHILEFSPAVKSYQTVGTDGFRTFVKMNDKVTEFFGSSEKIQPRNMRIKRSEFTIEEFNKELGLNIKVTYFGLPNENVAALVRIVEVTNVTNKAVSLELLDGLSQLLPTGTSQGDMKFLTNLIRSWMEVYNLEKNIGYFRMRSSTADQAEVVEETKGNFYISSVNDVLTKPIVDQRLVFGQDTTKAKARHFEQNDIQDIYDEEQVTANKIPVGFTGTKCTLKPNETLRINTLIGNIHSSDYLLELAEKMVTASYVDQKRKEAFDEIEGFLQEVNMTSNFPIFDDYIKQNYLDNIMRGGYPLILNGENEKFVYHLYSRRHGDLERDYNYFTIAPEFYSQGNGSFRDVCQNRRSDILFNPLVGDFNMKMFASFIQPDGYNPMSIDGSSFEISSKTAITRLVNELFNGSEIMHEILSSRFTPGSIINTMANNNITSSISDDELFDKIFKHATQNYEAHFAEGYWIDHWTYILDLVENYEGIFPDKMVEKLFDDITYKYYDSPVFVSPRDQKICLREDKTVRRFGSLLHDDNEKVEKLKMDPSQASWLKDHNDNVIYGNLFEKLFVLAVNKIACIDPSGMGIEMEADKPGWNDAMNGLPGLFGSGVSETIELKRVVKFLKKHLDKTHNIKLPSEFIEFVDGVGNVLNTEFDDFSFWDKVNTVKESYRANIRFGTKGLQTLSSNDVSLLLNLMENKIEMALNKAFRFGNGIYPTYLVHEVTEYEENKVDGRPVYGNYGLPTVRPLAFKVRALPYYLEAPARGLKVMNNKATKQTMFNRIKASNIYDHELKFYKTSEFLDKESNEIGRGRSFTKGWQERESNFLHMSYKYLLGLLKGGLYEEYFEEIKTNLTCFMDPTVYGRSTLENSSFIASSINPDPFVRGQGYVARLSGSTAEMLSIWAYMMFGKEPFILENQELKLNLKPLITKEFFKDNKLSFNFLGKTKVTYINESNIDTFDPNFNIKKYEVNDIELTEIKGSLAKNIRDGLIQEIKVYF
ncbi:cellobiose phosphorylase [Candidatus Izimaplasma bacterium]|nr:cellobiose phosphorylase [Candidatus Izimaplasma bacterium]